MPSPDVIFSIKTGWSVGGTDCWRWGGGGGGGEKEKREREKEYRTDTFSRL